jgi:hypothetical protein
MHNLTIACNLNRMSRFEWPLFCFDRLYGPVVRVSGYRSRGPGFDFRRDQVFWKVASLELGPLSLVKVIEELFQD